VRGLSVAYVEGAAYISHADLAVYAREQDAEGLLGLIAADSLRWREVASGILDEAAQRRGLTPPLADSYLTPVMRARLVGVALHRGAGQMAPEYRDAQGVAPYKAEHDRALAEIEAWSSGREATGSTRVTGRPRAFTGTRR
jgi:hypothetical protein